MEDTFNFNKDDELRQSIMGIKTDYKFGGIHYFHEMTLDIINKLLENNFIDLNYRNQTNSPSIKEFIDFATKYINETIYFCGFIISPKRNDYDIVITGMMASSHDKSFMEDFENIFGEADGFECRDGKQSCWYD